MKLLALFQYWYCESCNIWEGEDFIGVYESREHIPKRYRPLKRVGYRHPTKGSYFFYFVREINLNQ